MLLVLFLGIADFGRVFQAGIIIEARRATQPRQPPRSTCATRLRLDCIPAPSPPLDPNYYDKLHTLAARTACRESQDLANTTYIPDDPGTPVDDPRCTSASGGDPAHPGLRA